MSRRVRRRGGRVVRPVSAAERLQAAHRAVCPVCQTGGALIQRQR